MNVGDLWFHGITTDHFLTELNIKREDLSKEIPGIYKFTCTSNEKFYIGQSEKNVYDRLIKNYKYIARYGTFNPELNNDIYEYGIENFKFEIIAYCSREYSRILEMLLIANESINNGELLYNRNHYQYKLCILKDLNPFLKKKYADLFSRNRNENDEK